MLLADSSRWIWTELEFNWECQRDVIIFSLRAKKQREQHPATLGLSGHWSHRLLGSRSFLFVLSRKGMLYMNCDAQYLFLLVVNFPQPWLQLANMQHTCCSVELLWLDRVNILYFSTVSFPWFGLPVLKCNSSCCQGTLDSEIEILTKKNLWWLLNLLENPLACGPRHTTFKIKTSSNSEWNLFHQDSSVH